MTPAEDLAAGIKQLLAELRQPETDAYLADWPHEPERRVVPPSALPVLRWLSSVWVDDAAFAPALVGALCRASPRLQWRQTYSTQEVPGAFLDNYGWTELLGTCGPLASDRMACGILILGPATLYPRHRHQAEEVYLPLSGTAEWQQGDAVWRRHRPGTLVHHASDEPHSMRTGETPLLALYLWRGAGLAQKSQLESGQMAGRIVSTSPD